MGPVGYVTDFLKDLEVILQMWGGVMAVVTNESGN